MTSEIEMYFYGDTSNLDIGTYTIYYKVEDYSRNEANYSFTLTVGFDGELYVYETITAGTEIRIISYSEFGPKDVVIPDMIDGLPVTIIGEKAFENLRITSLVIGSNVEVIEASAFRYSRLEEINLPDSFSDFSSALKIFPNHLPRKLNINI